MARQCQATLQANPGEPHFGRKLILASLLVAVALALLSSPAVSQPDLVPAQVIRVIDGDTFVARINGNRDTVRLIGVDTPEMTGSSEAQGMQAKEFASRYIADREVWLEHDVQLRDRYGRRLAYVWLSQPDSRELQEIRILMFNAVLVAEGYARTLTVPPNVRYVEVFQALQTGARNNGRGLWSDSGTVTGQAKCHPSYPDVCIPPPPPDLDCRDIPFRRFRVLPPDPHGFDGDKDGIGCERN